MLSSQAFTAVGLLEYLSLLWLADIWTIEYIFGRGVYYIYGYKRETGEPQKRTTAMNEGLLDLVQMGMLFLGIRIVWNQWFKVRDGISCNLLLLFMSLLWEYFTFRHLIVPLSLKIYLTIFFFNEVVKSMGQASETSRFF